MNCPSEHTAGWPAGRKCHCSACHQNFSIVKHFDSHKPGECLSPESIGLTLNKYNVWVAEGEVDLADRLQKKETV